MTRNFRTFEFKCPCCGLVELTPKLLDNLQALRDFINRRKPRGEGREWGIAITSGFRCFRHNREVGGKNSSYHLIGRAADIHVPGMDVTELHDLVVQSRLFNGIGFYPQRGFVHVDTRVKPGRWTE